MGRPKRYTTELADSIAMRLAAGESLRSICGEPEMPERTTVYRWVVNDENGFCNQYARAKNIQIESAIDEILEWCDKAIEEPQLTQAIKLKIDSLKWIASKIMAKKYGDKQQVELTGKDGESLQISVQWGND